MAGYKITELPVVTTLASTNLALVVTGATNNASSGITIGNFAKGLISDDADNGLTFGTDSKLFVDLSIVDDKADITSLKGYIDGLVTGSSSASAYTISSGICLSSDNTTLIELSAMTKLVSSFTVGTGNGSLDSGTVANNTWYYVYAIYNPTTQVSDILMSTSYPTPTLPSGFTKYRFIDAIYYATATLNFGYKYGTNKKIMHFLGSIVSGLTTVGGTPLSVSGLLYPACGCLANIYVSHDTSAAATQATVDTGVNTPTATQIMNFSASVRFPTKEKLLTLAGTANTIRLTTGSSYTGSFRLGISEYEIER